jgi:hypothetical protein
LLLNEAANICPLPGLPALVASGGGRGTPAMVVLQSPGQARHRWGEAQAEALWDAANVKLIFGGLAGAHDLSNISQLAGDIDQPTLSRYSGAAGDGWSTGIRRVPVLGVDDLRQQRFGDGFYQNYFQKPGVAEATLEKDVAATFRLAFSGVRNPEPTEGFLGLFVEPEALPEWLTEKDLATFVEQFTAKRLRRRSELVPQPRPQLGADNALARRSDHRADAVHQRRERLDASGLPADRSRASDRPQSGRRR